MTYVPRELIRRDLSPRVGKYIVEIYSREYANVRASLAKIDTFVRIIVAETL